MDCARAFSLRLDTAKNECVCIQAASEVALKEQTFWPLVGSDVMSTGWHTASNTQPPPPPSSKNWGTTAWGEKTRARFKGKCLSL